MGVNADSMKFPEDWLFRWRWAKGRKQKNRIKKAGLDKSEAEESVSEGGEEEGQGEGEEMEGEKEDVRPKNKQFFELVCIDLRTLCVFRLMRLA